MKKILTLFTILITFALFQNTNAQLAQNSWAFGFGLTYPRYVSTNVVPSNYNYGLFASIQRNFTEQVGLRFKGGFSHLEANSNKYSTNALTGDFDLIYYMVPWEKVTPYFLFGFGGNYFTLGGATKVTPKSTLDYEINLGLGAEWVLNKKWNLKTEFAYHTVANTHFDGVYGTIGGGVLGANADGYMTFDVGLVYYFKKGKPSKLNQLYNGISKKELANIVDYERIENIVKKYIPRVIEKQVVVEKPVAQKAARWVLIGVDFGFNSARLRSEAYPILFHAAQVLLENPEINVEIQGYTDNIGSARYNKKLSERRAQVVKNYLVARGVQADRLTVKGYGEANPIASNKTAVGRAMNRRIEFKVIR